MNKKCPFDERIRRQLNSGGFRITHGRVALLKLLYKAKKPLSVQEILESWSYGTPLNHTTLYRTLTDLSVAGIVDRIDLNTGTAHFEYAPDMPHHHHIICNGCGLIEDVEHCVMDAMQERLTRSSKFRSIYSHNLEFFGQCKNCLKS